MSNFQEFFSLCIFSMWAIFFTHFFFKPINSSVKLELTDLENQYYFGHFFLEFVNNFPRISPEICCHFFPTISYLALLAIWTAHGFYVPMFYTKQNVLKEMYSHEIWRNAFKSVSWINGGTEFKFNKQESLCFALNKKHIFRRECFYILKLYYYFEVDNGFSQIFLRIRSSIMIFRLQSQVTDLRFLPQSWNMDNPEPKPKINWNDRRKKYNFHPS
jgi:hypothetical protein